MLPTVALEARTLRRVTGQLEHDEEGRGREPERDTRSELGEPFGRRRILLIGNAAGIPIGLIVFPIMNNGETVGFAIAMCLILATIGISYGLAAAYLPELFDTRHRYTGAGLGYNLAGILGGAIPIVIAGDILDAWGSTAIGYYLAGLALVSTLCMLALPETRAADLTVSARRAQPKPMYVR